MIFVYLTFSVVILLNMLIAMMAKVRVSSHPQHPPGHRTGSQCPRAHRVRRARLSFVRAATVAMVVTADSSARTVAFRPTGARPNRSHQTFDTIYSNYTRNYKVMRVRIFVSYLYLDLQSAAPFNLLGVPYHLYRYMKKIIKKWGERDKTESCWSFLRAAYPERKEFDHEHDDLESVTPAQGDGTSQFFQVNAWNKSFHKDAKKGREERVARASLPTKTLLWIAKLDRLHYESQVGVVLGLLREVAAHRQDPCLRPKPA